MQRKPITANPSQIIVEQLAASGVKYVFNNSGSREAHFFDALHGHADIHGILALHEGSVTAMAGGYTQVKLDPGVMVVHLGAGLAQAMGQLINVWTGSLPVVVITFAGDTGSFGDTIGLDISHNFGPTAISAPFVKANWTVVEPEGLPAAIDRALRVAMTPPVGPVHLAVYDRLLGDQTINTSIIEGGIPESRAGYPSDQDLEQVAMALHEADRPLIYVGDGVWKSGAESLAASLAERFGAAVATGFGDLRAVPIKHRLHAGRFDTAAAALNPDLILSIGARHSGAGLASDYGAFESTGKLIAIGSDIENLKNMPGLDLAVLADERRALERLTELVQSETDPGRYDDRRTWAIEQASSLRGSRRHALQAVGPQQGRVRPWALINGLDEELERVGGGLVTIEQFAVPPDTLGGESEPGNNVYIRPAGGSEGYGIGGAVGAKLAAPDSPVVGLVGDGSMFYSDSGLWTAAHHGVPVLYVIPNNQAYGVVANAFNQAEAGMKHSGEYAGVALDGIDPVKIAEGFGVEARNVEDEATVGEAIAHGLETVEREGRPFLLNVRLPQGLPAGGKPARQFRMR
ncbi:MAG: thiamine pyrophosphate-binding protein [SAR202 cluster bacterium]|jgi:benzoylformate decarboxylase|nr:thiamine pyrophosphate-binding protein [SAR202 cluster bacterium]MDP7104941.1 thiamine pyrophosphate-binding protein [SAR202 cluster bacterium]MDP7226892.1 thiamine pyrophosphate-binding protein [SAR202 cluster bacterium]MDP7413033.1 thiamine pyrophosphate-binding protein [SAR202 cluster bacterium]HJO82866.1 thiamine pyrophosphate-binding protein [SAR202 cluster bacterium]|tara:strand:+ start:3645 stop:5369 length:1725 start_codon:yes stop_codon:yes gene_type:complete